MANLREWRQSNFIGKYKKSRISADSASLICTEIKLFAGGRGFAGSWSLRIHLRSIGRRASRNRSRNRARGSGRSGIDRRSRGRHRINNRARVRSAHDGQGDASDREYDRGPAGHLCGESLRAGCAQKGVRSATTAHTERAAAFGVLNQDEADQSDSNEDVNDSNKSKHDGVSLKRTTLGASLTVGKKMIRSNKVSHGTAGGFCRPFGDF